MAFQSQSKEGVMPREGGGGGGACVLTEHDYAQGI